MMPRFVYRQDDAVKLKYVFHPSKQALGTPARARGQKAAGIQ